jgi:formate dehydrogenase subunit beta
MGAYTNADYRRFSEKETTATFYGSVLSGKGTAVSGADLAPACSICEHPVPEGADIIIGLFGIDVRNNLLIQGMTPKGESMLCSLGLPESGEPEERRSAIESLISLRTKSRDNMFDKTAHATDTLEKLTAWLSGCINCYNCRVVCPVCYCKECVFVTDVFRHEPSQYLQWAERKGVVKMPTDTIFYHLTRMAHMSTACVGCGQCSNACPNDINVMELFRTVAHNTQKAFNYEAGRSPDEAPPLSEFREQEFGEVVGIN